MGHPRRPNAVDQANRELKSRFDFRGTEARFELEGFVVTQRAPSDFQLKQMLEILPARLAARGIDLRRVDLTLKDGWVFEPAAIGKALGIVPRPR